MPLAFFFSFFFFFFAALWGIWISVPQPGMEPVSLALEVWSLNRWTTTEVSMPVGLYEGNGGFRMLTTLYKVTELVTSLTLVSWFPRSALFLQYQAASSLEKHNIFFSLGLWQLTTTWLLSVSQENILIAVNWKMHNLKSWELCFIQGITEDYSSELPWWLTWWRVCLQCRRPKFNPCVGKTPGEGNGNPLQRSCLENPRDGGAWQVTVHGVTKNGHDWATSLSL